MAVRFGAIKKILKSILGLNRGTANCMVYGELGRVSLFHTVEKRMINFWARISQSVLGNSKLSSMIYLYVVCMIRTF